jgi:hypothetical protein
VLTLSLQTAAAILKVLFVGVAVFVARRTTIGQSTMNAGWRWVAIAFAVSGVAGLLQSAWAIDAVRSGPSARSYALYLEWLPAMNYGSFGIAILLGLALAALPYLPERERRPGRGWFILVVIAGAIGVLLGRVEGGFDPAVNISRVSALQALETVVLLAALWTTLLRQALDSWLWLAMFVYAIRQAVNALVWAATVWVADPDGWHPPFWLSPSVGVAMWLVMIALALRRLHLARLGLPARAIFALPGGEEPGGLVSGTGIDAPRH